METEELLLAIENVTLLSFRPDAPTHLLATGQLDLVVTQTERVYSLRIQDQVILLTPEVQVLKGIQNAYVLVRATDMLGLSADPPIAEEIAEVLEMVFADACQFIRESTDQTTFERVIIVESEDEDSLIRPPPEGRLKRLFHSGKEKLKAGLVKGASLAFITYLKAKVYLKRRFSKTRSIARPQERTISLQQAAEALKKMSAEGAGRDEEMRDIMQNYGRMSQHLASVMKAGVLNSS